MRKFLNSILNSFFGTSTNTESSQVNKSKDSNEKQFPSLALNPQIISISESYSRDQNDELTHESHKLNYFKEFIMKYNLMGYILFFISALFISLILYYPSIMIFLILWLLYFQISSSSKSKGEDNPESNSERKYYDCLKLLHKVNFESQEKTHSSNLLSKLKEYEFLYSFIQKLMSSTQKNEFFSFDKWLKEMVGQILPNVNDKEFENFVKNDRDEILSNFEKLVQSDGNKEGLIQLFKSILYSKQPDIIPFDENNCPTCFKNKTFNFPKCIDENNLDITQKEYSIIEGKYLWNLIHGDVSPFLTYDYSFWYSKNSITPYWLIPFSLYRWWSPNEDSFIKKFILFEKEENLSDSIKRNMYNDPLFLFISALIKEINQLSPNLEISKIATIFNNKFEAYCLIGLLNAERIIRIDPIIYRDVVNQCINYLIDKKKISWTLSAFVLNKEKYNVQLKQLLETFCEESDSLNKDEMYVIDPNDDENCPFSVSESLVYEVKGEKQVARAIRTPNSTNFKQYFDNGISCLFKAGKYLKVTHLLASYYFRRIAEIGHGERFIVDWCNKIDEKMPNDFAELAISYIGQISDLRNNNNGSEESLNDEEKLSSMIFGTNDEEIDFDKQLEIEIEYLKDFVIFDSVSKAFEHKEISENICNCLYEILSNKWKTFKLRRFVCSVLMKQKNMKKYLINIDGFPEDDNITLQNLNDIDSMFD